MGRRKKACRVPYLPLEIKLLIVEVLSAERDLDSLWALRTTDMAFASLSKPEVYRHIDFRGKSQAALELFINDVGPSLGAYVRSVCQRPVDNDSDTDLKGPIIEIDYGSLMMRDAAIAGALKLLPNVEREAADEAWQLVETSGIKALHLAGRSIQHITCHILRIRPPLTHLILGDDDNLPWSDLRLLIISLSPNLTSLAIRQQGTLDEMDPGTPASTATLLASDVPHLTRLVLSLNGELFSILSKFTEVDSLSAIELGTDDVNFTRLLVDLVTGLPGVTNWPKLAELSFQAPSFLSEDWTALSEVCESRGIEFIPGFDHERDWPEDLD